MSKATATSRYAKIPKFAQHGDYLKMKTPKAGSIKRKRLQREVFDFIEGGGADPSGRDRKLPPPAIQK